MKVYLGNLSLETTEQQLRDLVTPFGKAGSIALVMDTATGKTRGFGFVEFDTTAEGTAAVAGLNGRQIDGRNLIVNEARARTNAPAASAN